MQWYRFEAVGDSAQLVRGLCCGAEGLALVAPVLDAFTRLTQQGFCCAWRTQPTNASIHELWLFDFGVAPTMDATTATSVAATVASIPSVQQERVKLQKTLLGASTPSACVR